TEDHPGTKYLHKDGKFTRGKGLFKAISYTHPVEEPDQAYPLVLTTGRNLYQYHTRTMTSKVEGLTAKAGESYVEIGPVTAAQYGVGHGDMVRVSSPRGAIEVQARVLPRVRDGLIFVPFHYGEAGANILTAANLDPVCRIPEFKVLKARIEKLSDAGPGAQAF
ncbi:MAG: formate dehydrogenase subunit alpha, partial [Candidatus Adiutrix sp.]|nr:formate dehydrogenase subunit alpha [Candidatus Adiutrix sp.]